MHMCDREEDSLDAWLIAGWRMSHGKCYTHATLAAGDSDHAGCILVDGLLSKGLDNVHHPVC